jgi:glycerophosphoryl diester phosphodiesterase
VGVHDGDRGAGARAARPCVRRHAATTSASGRTAPDARHPEEPTMQDLTAVPRRAHRALRAAALAAVALAAAAATPAAAAGQAAAPAAGTLTGARPIVIGHRGASGYRPEHTLEAYRLAIRQGADFIEPDLVLTKDGVPIARHEPLFGATAVNGVALPPRNEFTTTDVLARPEFADRLRTRDLDGTRVTGFWSDDFTLAEVKTLRAVERIPALRPGNTPFDGLYEIPTLQEVVDLARTEGAAVGRTIGIYPETKHPTFFAANAGNRTTMARFEDAVVAVLHANYGNRADAPVFLQSFEVANLGTCARSPRSRSSSSSTRPAAGRTTSWSRATRARTAT